MVGRVESYICYLRCRMRAEDETVVVAKSGQVFKAAPEWHSSTTARLQQSTGQGCALRASGELDEMPSRALSLAAGGRGDRTSTAALQPAIRGLLCSRCSNGVSRRATWQLSCDLVFTQVSWGWREAGTKPADVPSADQRTHAAPSAEDNEARQLTSRFSARLLS